MVILARDVMQTDVLTVAPTLSVVDLADLLIRERVSGVPVVTDGALVGVVSRSDLVRTDSLDRSLAGLVGEASEPFEFSPGSEPAPPLRSVTPEGRAKTVRDIMVTNVVTVGPETAVAEVARVLVARHLHRMVVVDGTLVCGIISALDLVRLIADGRLHSH
jgi:CBS domain-containing protein